MTRDRVAWRKYMRERTARWRLAVLDKLGGKCMRCGFADSRALQIDHVHGGGTQEMMTGRRNGKRSKRIGDITTHYRRVFFDQTGKYQLLCANCNWIKRAENNEIKRLPLEQALHFDTVKMDTVELYAV